LSHELVKLAGGGIALHLPVPIVVLEMIIDNATVITGSFNFTIAAEGKNAENLLIIHDKDLAQRYTENWYVHAAHSKPLP